MRDFHLIEDGETAVLFFPATYRLFRLPGAQAAGAKAFLEGRGPMPPKLAPVVEEESRRAPPADPKPWGETDSLCLYVAQECNLACAYCYNDGGRAAGPVRMMAPEVAEAAFRRFFTEPGRQYAASFYGGEPLLNFRTLRAAVETGRRLEGERGLKIAFSLTTNGTVLTDEMLDFLGEHFASATVSLDGPKVINDHFRRGTGGGSHDRAVANLRRLKERCRGRVTLKGTLAGPAVPFYSDSLAYLGRLGADGAILTPAGTPQDNPAAIGDGEYRNFVRQHAALTADAMARQLEGETTEEAFNVAANLLTRRKLRRHCNAGRDLAVAADGSLYACHGLAGIAEFYMGKVDEPGSPDFRRVQETFSALDVDSSEECTACWARYFCGGSCYAHGYFATGGVHRPDPRHCQLVRRCTETAILGFLDAMGQAEKRERLMANVKQSIGAHA